MKAAKKIPKPAAAASTKTSVIICGLLAVLTLALFWPVSSHDFINYDDPDYVSANPIVQAGVTAEGIKWAFTTTHSYNWHPITWISHMMDFQFLGSKPGTHHMMSVFIHVLNVLLLFILLRNATGAVSRSGFVAAIFALHPLHVESVAWACERKDVLSCLFGLGSILLYVEYMRRSNGVRAPKNFHYIASVALFALSLMSKPMLVTLPFVLLLLDFWPLGRMTNRATSQSANRASLTKIVMEKLPFLALTLLSSVVTYLAQRREGAVVELQYFPLTARLANAVVSYVRYMGKTVWPGGLTVYYEPPPQWPIAYIAGAAVILIVISAVAIWVRRSKPYVGLGWCWFLGTLVPVIGIVQVGAQAIADRYMYFPMIGLLIACAWGGTEMISRLPSGKRVLGVLGICLVITSFVYSREQIPNWRNSETVFRHAIAVSPTNAMAHVMLANTLGDQQRFEEAAEHYKQALQITPMFPEVHYNLGNIFVQQNRLAEAEAEYKAALQQEPNYLEAHANVAVVLSRLNRTEEAIEHERAGLKINPQQPDLLRNMAIDLITLRRFDEARESLSHAIEMQPSQPILYLLLGNTLAAQKNFQEAARQYSEALRLQPDLTEARQRLDALQRQHTLEN